MSEAIVSRLDLILNRLDQIVSTGLVSPTSAAPIAAAAKTVAASVAAAPAGPQVGGKTVDDFATVLDAVKAWKAAAGKLADLKEFTEIVDQVVENHFNLIKAATVSKKPTDTKLQEFLKPTAEAIGKSGKMDYKSSSYAHQQAINASLPAFSWPLCPPPKGYVEAMAESADMYLNRVLISARSLEGDAKKDNIEFVNSWKKVLAELKNYVVENFKAGLEWNFKGNDLSAFSATAAAPAAAAAAPAPPADIDFNFDDEPAAEKASAPAGMAALFGDISKGLSITSGLKKVTNDMKSKNQKDVPTLAPKAVASKVETKAAAPVAKKPPTKVLKEGSWYVENYEGEHLEFPADQVDIKTNFYFGNLKNVTIRIGGKSKSITFDKCVRVQAEVDATLSSVESVNSERLTVYIKSSVPTVALDKSKGVIVNLSREAYTTSPDFITSNISECNIQIPGATDEDDLIELPIPEQFITKIQGLKLNTTTVKHG